MTDYDEPEEQPEPVKRRGWRRFFKRGLLAMAIVGFVFLLARWQVGRVGQRQLDTMIAHLDDKDRGWRLDEIEAARTQAAPTDDKNPSNIVIALHKSIPPEWNGYLSGRLWDWGAVSNYRPSFFESVWLEGGKELTTDVRESCRRQLLRPEILACPGGHYVLIHNENPLTTLLPNTQNARSVVALLDYDARILVLAKKYNQALSSARASLVVAKSIGDEPYLISQLVRMACARVSVQTAIQVLALSEPSEGLAELQKELRAEADVPWLQYGIRGERGSFSKLFGGLQKGTIKIEDLQGISSDFDKWVLKKVAFQAYKPMLPGDQAKSLEILTAYLEASKLPPHEQKAALKQVHLPPRPPEDFRYLVTSLMIPACEKVAEATWRTRADLLTGSVAIACERFRIAHNRWPKTLDEIPKDILPDIPLDPFNGRPIQYQRLEDGAAIFTIGDERDAEKREQNKNMLANIAAGTNVRQPSRDDANDPLVMLGRGWRLWDPKFRNLQHPLPPADPVDP